MKGHFGGWYSSDFSILEKNNYPQCNSLHTIVFFKEFQSTHDRLMQSLKFHAASGQLSLDNLHADDFSLGPSSVVADCPPGTLLRPDHRSSQRFACGQCTIVRYDDWKQAIGC